MNVHHFACLPQMLKASQPEKPKLPEHQNGVLPKKETKENISKNIPKNDTHLGKKNPGKKVKTTTAAVPKDACVKLKAPADSQPGQSTAPKRKQISGKSNSEQAAKKQKSVAEETKPLE